MQFAKEILQFQFLRIRKEKAPEFQEMAMDHSEDGVVESTLVMIPLLALFLATLTLIVAVNFRNIDLARVQSAASIAAISSNVSADDEVVVLNTVNSHDELRLLVSKSKRALPQFLPDGLMPGFSGAHFLQLTGIAVMEKERD